MLEKENDLANFIGQQVKGNLNSCKNIYETLIIKKELYFLNENNINEDLIKTNFLEKSKLTYEEFVEFLKVIVSKNFPKGNICMESFMKALKVFDKEKLKDLTKDKIIQFIRLLFFEVFGFFESAIESELWN